MRVIWSPRAIRHLIALREYIAKDSEENAARIAERLLGAVELLATQPEMGRPGRVLGTRELVVADKGYIIPYRVHRDRLELMAVFHGRQFLFPVLVRRSPTPTWARGRPSPAHRFGNLPAWRHETRHDLCLIGRRGKPQPSGCSTQSLDTISHEEVEHGSRLSDGASDQVLPPRLRSRGRCGRHHSDQDRVQKNSETWLVSAQTCADDKSEAFAASPRSTRRRSTSSMKRA